MSGADARTAPLSMQEQGFLIDELVSRCIMHDGTIAGSATLTLERDQIKALTDLANRLHRIAPFEGRIRDMVMRR